MATKANGQQTKAAPKGAAGVNDLETLNPDREIHIDGRVITLRQYKFFEGLDQRTKNKPFFDDLYRMFEEHKGPPSFDDVLDVVALHQDAVISMVADSAGVEPAWVASLDELDGERVMLAWWTANVGFFIRRVLRRAAAQRLGSPSAGPASSTPSSPPDTSEAPPTSEP